MTADDIFAGITVSFLDTLGFFINTLVLFGFFRIKKMHGIFGLLIANQCISQYFTVIGNIVFFGFGLTFGLDIILQNSRNFAAFQILCICLIPTHCLIISLNRMIAVRFPLAYRLIFTRRTIFRIILASWILPCSFFIFVFFVRNCEMLFMRWGWYFTADQGKCNNEISAYIYFSQMFLAFSITFCDLITILTLFKSRAKFLTSRDTRRQQLGFAKQVLLQGLIFNLYMFWYTKAGDFLPGKCDEWKQFFTTTFSSNLLNIIDPMIILIFNGEYRIWMFSLASENVQRVGISSVHINSLF